MRLSEEKDSLRIVADQIGAPTWARQIAETTAICIYQSIKDQHQNAVKSGTYNLASSGSASWYDFTKKIVDNANTLFPNKIMVEKITPIRSEEYPTPAKRPKNSKLLTTKLNNVFNVIVPDWEQSLSLCMEEMC